MPEIGVRYCGGCNSRYDRVALVKRLAGFFPAISFVAAQPGRSYTAALVVCGCPVRCAGVSDLGTPECRLVRLSGWEDLLPARARLEDILRENDPRALDHRQVLELLPQRPPMLFVDGVSRLIPGVEATASFYADPALSAFTGHFPGAPVLPGIYTLEAMAQTAGLLLLALPRYTGKRPLFMGARRANFHREIMPGDTLELQAILTEERAELGVAVCRCQALVRGALAADGELRLALRPSASEKKENVK